MILWILGSTAAGLTLAAVVGYREALRDALGAWVDRVSEPGPTVEPNSDECGPDATDAE